MNLEFFMQEAILEAHKALELNEVPIGCVIVYENEIIARGHNIRNSSKNSLGHAEIMAINQACNFIDDWRLEKCSMFVTIEPCPMCAGAIVQSRLENLIFGATNKKAGCCGSTLNIVNNSLFNHQVNVTSGILEEECSLLMKNFFKKFR